MLLHGLNVVRKTFVNIVHVTLVIIMLSYANAAVLIEYALSQATLSHLIRSLNILSPKTKSLL